MIQKFEFHNTEIPGLIEVTPFNADDIRGCFTKDYSKEIFEQNGIHYDLAEIFYTTSHKGVIRALHFQRVKQQPKLVRCIYGHVYDVVVDLRKDSPSFKKWLGFDLIGESIMKSLCPQAVLTDIWCWNHLLYLISVLKSFMVNMTAESSGMIRIST